MAPCDLKERNSEVRVKHQSGVRGEMRNEGCNKLLFLQLIESFELISCLSIKCCKNVEKSSNSLFCPKLKELALHYCCRG